MRPNRASSLTLLKTLLAPRALLPTEAMHAGAMSDMEQPCMLALELLHNVFYPLKEPEMRWEGGTESGSAEVRKRFSNYRCNYE